MLVLRSSFYAAFFVMLWSSLAAFETQASEVVTGYFVDCDAGNDSASGTNHTAPWRTLSKVSSTVRTTGSDVWIKAGSVCSNQSLRVDWAGTSSDRVVLGSYYVSSGVAYASEPSNARLNPKDRTFPNGRATVSGSYKPSCRVWTGSGITCAFETANAVPSGRYGGLIQVSGAPYITIQSLVVRDSAGNGIGVDGVADPNRCYSGNAACEDYIVVKDNLISHIGHEGINFQESRYGVLSGNEVEYTGLLWADSIANPSGGITIVRCDPCGLLVENNYVHDQYGESIAPFGVSNVLIRGNYVSNGHRGLIYFDGAADVVAEQNILAGGGPTAESGLGDPARRGASPAFFATALIKEPSNTSNGSAINSAERHLIRNNLIANFETCFRSGIVGAGDTDDLVSGAFVGNTCIGADGQAATSSGVPEAQTAPAGVEIANNIFATSTGAPTCDHPNNSLIDLHHNYWGGSPSDENCRHRGTGDVYATHAALSLGKHNFAGSTKLDFPTYDWFSIPATSSAAGRGTVLAREYLSTSLWSWVLAQRSWMPACQSSQVSAAEFVKVLTTDYCGQMRSNGSPNIGALGATVGGANSFELVVD